MSFVHVVVVSKTNESQPFYRAWSPNTKEVKIDDELCYRLSPDMRGKWIKVLINESNSAVGQVRIMPKQRFRTQVVEELVEIQVEFKHKGRFHDRLEMFNNDYFGDISDPLEVLKEVSPGAMYRGWITRNMDGTTQWRLAKVGKMIKIFETPRSEESELPMEISEKGLYKVGALVIGAIKNGYRAWSSQKIIDIPASFCPENKYMLSRWVEVMVDENNCAQRPVKLLDDVRRDDVLETRLFRGQVELLVNLYGMSVDAVYNKYIGSLMDDAQVIRDLKKGGCYKCYICARKIESGVFQWTISEQVSCDRQIRESRNFSPQRPSNSSGRDRRRDQPLRQMYGGGPLPDRHFDGWAGQSTESSSNPWRQNNHGPQETQSIGSWYSRFSGSSSQARSGTRSPSPSPSQLTRLEIRQEQPRRRSPEARRAGQATDNRSHAVTSSNAVIVPSNTLPQRPSNSPDHDRRRDQPPRQMYGGGPLPYHHFNGWANQSTESRSDPWRHRDHGLQETQAIGRWESRFSGSSSQARSGTRSPSPSPSQLPRSEMRQEQPRRRSPETRQAPATVNGSSATTSSNAANVPSSSGSTAAPVPLPAGQRPKRQYTKEELKIMELELKLERAGEIIQFMFRNKEIEKLMKLMDIEQVDELLELTAETEESD